ncbi:MAG: type II secretion system F family protein [Actinomycetota bacterium]|nr:type II secretion system F family protein [Actinomycetota bacterium]
MALTFDYKVRDKSGNMIEGELEGESLPLVAGRLREMGYLPITITPRKGGGGLGLRREIRIPGITNRIKLKDVAVATRQLATMIDSGLTVVRALGVLAEQTENAELGRILNLVRRDLDAGSTLANALARHPKVFSPMYVTMVAAGEAGGNLEIVLQGLAQTLENQVVLNRKVRSAMTYPAVVVTVMILIFGAILIFIVPIFKNLFATLGGQLPAPTRVVIGISHAVTSLWALLILAVIVAIVVGFRKWINTDGGRIRWDRLKLKPPVFGPLAHKVALARFAATLSSLIGAGVPILESLDIVTATSGNKTIGDAIQHAKQGVRDGRSLAAPLSEHDVIPTLVTQMIDIGEQTGSLDDMLGKVAEFYNDEVATTVANLTAILEPALTVIMGVGVGAMVISLYLPMFDYVKLLEKPSPSL